MNLVTAHVIYGNPETELWENVAHFEIEPYQTPDYSGGVEAIKQAMADFWCAVEIPTGETIELMATYKLDSDNFSLNVRQGTEAISQVVCEGMPSVCFRTLGGATINIQIHERGAFVESKDAKE